MSKNNGKRLTLLCGTRKKLHSTAQHYAVTLITILKITTTMKLIKTIAISFLTLVTQITTAQVPYNGKHFLFSAAACDKEICCNRMSQQVVTYCHKLVASGIRHFFIVHDISTNTTKQFFLDPYYTPGIAIHPTTITINDMRITDLGECWFCGKKTIVTGQIYYPGTGWLD